MQLFFWNDICNENFLFLQLNINDMKRVFYLTVLLFGMFSYSCVGPRGEDGFDGLDGRDGRDGQDANVGVAIYDIEPQEWSGGLDGYIATIVVPEITEDVYYEGAVLVYFLRDENTNYKNFIQLPYTYIDNSYAEYLDFDVYVGEIDMHIREVINGENSTSAPDGLYSYKVVVIEGYTLATLQNMTDISDMQNVLELF